MVAVFLVLLLIFLVLIAVVYAGAVGNRQANYQMGPGYVVPQPMIIDDTPLIAGMVAADIAEDIAFAATSPMGGMDQGQYYDPQDQGFDSGGGGGGDFLGGDQSFDSSSSGFDMGGGDF